MAGYFILGTLLTAATTFGVCAERWVRALDLRALNMQYEVLCAQMSSASNDFSPF